MADVSDALRVAVDRCNARRSHFPANLPPHPSSFYMDCADWDLMHAALAQALENDARYRWLRDRAQNAGRDPFIAQRSSYGLTQWSGDKADAAIDAAIAAQQEEAQ